MLTKIKDLESNNYAIKLYNVTESPLHMHDAYEMVFILRGTVDLKCTAFNYHLSEGDIFIINVKELHKFSNGSKDNLILTVYLDPYKYLYLFPNLDFYFFVCDSYASEEKNDQRLKYLQELFMNFALSYLDKDASEKDSEEHILSIITYIIRNYQSYTVIPQGYQSNTSLENRDYQTERIREIQGYLYQNAKNKITLDDLAEHLHLNKYYVSHLCKSVIGLSMTDFLSLIRVEQSEILLLSSDMSIEQIAFEYGFSAKRYYEKHFQKWHGVSPTEYRDIFLTNTDYKIRNIPVDELTSEALKETVDKYITKHNSTMSTSKTASFTVNMASITQPYTHFWQNAISISDPYNCMNFISQDTILQAKKDLGFDTIVLKNIFLNNEDGSSVYNHLRNLLDILVKSDVRIVINAIFPNTNVAAFYNMIAEFFKLISMRYGDKLSERWALEIVTPASPQIKKSQDISSRIKDDIAHYIKEMPVIVSEYADSTVQYSYNSVRMLPHIINACIKGDSNEVSLYRELYDSTTRSEDTSINLYANNGLLSSWLEKKPLYYLWQLMTSLGDEIISQTPGMIATKKGNSYIFMIYDHKSESLYAPDDTPVSYQLNLTNINKNYMVIKQYLDSNRCLLQQSAALNYPEMLSLEMIEMLNRSTAPEISFDHLKASNNQITMNYNLNPNSVLLIALIEDNEKTPLN